jgi:dUTP pyrophosphatase
MIEIKFKKLCAEATMPTKAHTSDAGADLTATSKKWDDEKQCWIYGTGIATEIPEGYVGLIFPRSSIRKYGLALANSIGVIDSGYRGEIMCSFKPTGSCHTYNVGDKIAQLIIMPYPETNYVEATELSDSERGENGHGSSGV